MTVFFNFFKKSATKRLLAYRYGARKGNLTFFENRSLNRWLLSLYDVKEETIFNFNLTIRSFHQMTTDIADMIEKDTAVPQGNDGIF